MGQPQADRRTPPIDGAVPYRSILVGFDASPEAADALALGRGIARQTGAALLVATVLPYGPSPALGRETFERWLSEDSKQLFDPILPNLEGLDFSIHALGGGSPARKLHELAEDQQLDLIVVGSTHRGALGRVLPGSVGERLLHGATCPVAIAPRGLATADWKLEHRVGVAYDGSDAARAAVDHAAALAQAVGLPLRVIGVVDPFVPAPFDRAVPREIEAARKHSESVDERRHRILEELLQQAVAEQSSAADAGYELLHGDPSEQLISASSGLDLLVLGSRCYGSLRHVLLGGVSAAVTRGAHCPTLVVPRGARERGRPLEEETAAISAGRD
jgi:nucleotide-binding universal stress UspA family protein